MTTSNPSTNHAATSEDNFSIFNFIDKLTPTKLKNRYFCPVCEGNNLTIDPKTGKYTCWSGCERKDIREEIAPWDEVKGNKRNSQAYRKPKPNSKPKNPKPAQIPDGDYSLARLPYAVESPASVKKSNSVEITYPYSQTQWVVRIEKPDGSKVGIPHHINANGETVPKKGDNVWLPYRMDEVRAYGSGKWVLGVEGEKCVEACRQLGLVGYTPQGADWGDDSLIRAMQLIKDSGVAGVAYFPDHDKIGYEKGFGVARAANTVGLPFILINPLGLWAECPEKGDIADWVKLEMNTEEFIRRLEAEIHKSADDRRQATELLDDGQDIPDSVSLDTTFLQKALNFLYADKPWISSDDKLYCHTGTYYKYIPDPEHINKITHFCNSFAVVINAEGEIGYPYANPGKVDEVLKWVKYSFVVNPELLNPPGINCTNGVLKVEYEDKKPIVKLHPHNESDYFTYEPLVEYNPKADTTDCDRLLLCLAKPQQEILLRTLAAAIDIDMVREFRGREVRLLLASGQGSNGKDSLREVASTIFGHSGMTSLSLADFASYDDGRKFGLAPLMNSRVNWASENPQTTRLDKIQSLKLFATGNKLHCERKGKDHIEFTPKGIGIFNINEPPSLQGTMQAIQDRIAVLEFHKTFKKNPDLNNPNELQADPRFAYDPEFVRTKVAPAFLNKMLEALTRLIAEGIDYECTSDAFHSMQKENNHLFQFCEDMTLGYKADGEMSARDLWSLLEKWYIDTGTLTLEEDGKRRVWIDQVKPSDKNVKGINQVISRILSLFPKAQKATRYDETAKRNVPIVLGIGFIENTRTTNENTRTTSAPVSAPETTQNQDFRTTRTTFNDMWSENEKINIEEQCLSRFETPEADTPKSGAGGAEPSNSNACNQEKWCGSGAEKLESGAGMPSLSADDHEAVLGSVENIKEIIALKDGEVLLALTQGWDKEFKLAVWVQLSTPERKAVERIAQGALYRDSPISKPVEPEQLPVPTIEQIRVGTFVWVYHLKSGKWLPGTVQEIDDRFSLQECWDVRSKDGSKITARSLEKLRLRQSRA